MRAMASIVKLQLLKHVIIFNWTANNFNKPYKTNIKQAKCRDFTVKKNDVLGILKIIKR